MDEEKKTRHRPILTILSAVFILLLWLTLALCLVTDSTVFGVLLLAAPFIAVVSLVITIVSRKERFKKTWTALLILDILSCLVAMVYLPLLSLRGLGLSMDERVRENAAEKAKIENVLKMVPKVGMTLHNLETADSPYDYFDGDGSIAEQFTSLDFTFVGEGDSAGTSPYYFAFDHETKATFSLSFDRVCVSAGEGDLWGHHSIQCKTYGFNAFEGRKLKSLIDERVKEQKEAYEKSRAEAFDGFSFEAALEWMTVSESKFICFYFNDSYEMGFTRVFDEDRAILQTFLDIDRSKVTLLEETPENGHYTLDYNDFHLPSPYGLYYYHPERCLAVSKTYKDPYGRNRTISLHYRVDEEEGEKFLLAAKEIIATRPIAY